MTVQLGMIAASIVAIAIAANAAMALADLAGARFVLANSAEVGVPRTWVPMLGLFKGAGAVGLLVGVLAYPPIGVAAAIGLTAFFVGAVITHIRARVFYNIAFPAAFLALAGLSLGAFAAG
ncbi:MULTISPECIES: DoxX family protein [unclassified Mycolicibacterium]|uniref:DoxX family protein n=1 Tax=unclassified Mycolicibacterium TaxID=2636767 RepID=UPI0012DF9EAF|nr:MULTISPECIES: DoxX family protein [unclassified Mycolicibacterium]MUL81245.1 DoxX family protein [Mycolicibacterium sp. CBMA 329]MUL87011.1 DoxX family protein [Mycolicibacterium sp. CBMA 331]MUL98706.1 DoxX family protein [Mycolicibacterium sp. CBMA 334]MUM25569.1 DoxX family protein [Mycolicibacterium sp. CBMA 295]MUM37308.1 DoxX family protein [Mycolicibacterium sp. CBMA 247]